MLVRRLTVILLALAVVSAACGGTTDDEAADSGAFETEVPLRWVTGEALAYPVPSDPGPSEHANDVHLRLVDEEGREIGEAWAPAGTPLRVRVADDDPSLVEVEWRDGQTAIGAREEFWVIPDFIALGDVEVTVDGREVPLVSSDLLYRRARIGSFDDAKTPEFEGIASPIRRWLRCEADSWKIANQYFAADMLADGVYASDREQVDLAVKALDWGTTVPTYDGEAVFSLHRDCDDTTARDPGETHHSTQWLVGLSRAVFILASSPYAGEYRAELDEYISYVEDFATVLTKPEVRDHWIERWVHDPVPGKGVFTHKYYMRAAGLSLAAHMTDDLDDAARWRREAWGLAQDGMEQQWDNGVNPERGGLDVRYQGYGTWLALVYYSTLDDGPRKKELGTAIDRAVGWLVSRIDPETGAIDLEGSTRTCVEPESIGKTEYHPYHTLSVLLLWSELSDDRTDLREIAVAHDAHHRSSETPCKVSLRD